MRTQIRHVLGMFSAVFLVLAFSGCMDVDMDPVNQTFAIGNLTNPCNNESVNLTGKYNQSMDDMYYYLQLHGTGEGNQSNRYVFNSNFEILYGSIPETINVELISKGKAPNFLIKIQIHIEGDEMIVDRAEAVCTNPHIVEPIPIS